MAVTRHSVANIISLTHEALSLPAGDQPEALGLLLEVIGTLPGEIPAETREAVTRGIAEKAIRNLVERLKLALAEAGEAEGEDPHHFVTALALRQRVEDAMSAYRRMYGAVCLSDDIEGSICLLIDENLQHNECRKGQGAGWWWSYRVECAEPCLVYARGEARAAREKHLEVCPSCRKEEERDLELDKRLRSLPPEVWRGI